VNVDAEALHRNHVIGTFRFIVDIAVNARVGVGIRVAITRLKNADVVDTGLSNWAI
jgi:hypothetical protein